MLMGSMGKNLKEVLTYLLNHDAVGSSKFKASGEIQGVHPTQHESKNHHRYVGLNSWQIQCCGHQNQHRVDEAMKQKGKISL